MPPRTSPRVTSADEVASRVPAKVPAQASLKVPGSWSCHHTLGISEIFSWPWEQVVSAGRPGPPIGGVPTLSGTLQTGAQKVATQAPWRRHPGHRPAFALVPKKQPSEGDCGVRRQGRSPTEGLGDDGVLMESSTNHQGPGGEDTRGLGARPVADTDPGPNPSLPSATAGWECGFLQARRAWCGGGEWAA